MKIDKELMELAAPWIADAERHVETLMFFVKNRDRLSLDARVPMYLNRLVVAVSALQQLFYNDEEFTELFMNTLAKVSEDREYHFALTKDHDGKQFFDVHGLLPLELVQQHMLLTGGLHNATVEISRSEYTRSKEGEKVRGAGQPNVSDAHD